MPLFALFGCSASQPPVAAATAKPAAAAPAPAPTAPTLAPLPQQIFPVMLGIDVLEAEGFTAVKGKRIGLLTHPAGVNRRGVSTVEVLRRAAGVKLVALYAVEHGIYNDRPAEKTFDDMVDSRTGLPVFSLYNGQTKKFRPTPQQLKSIDALVIDLQDIGTRSYTFTGAMKSAMEACFENGKEVIVLDRPNPLGGLKVDGPSLDPDLMTDVGRFRVPYVHGLTMGELARMTMALQPPSGLAIPEAVRARSKLTVIPMRGWRRAMRWTETGLPFVPTSTRVQDFAAVIGYAMVGLGCEGSDFEHGIGKEYPFRGVYYRGKTVDQLEKDLTALRLPGLKFRKVSAPDDRGKPATGVFVEVADWDDWNPTELSFHMMRLACRYSPPNPFAKMTAAQDRTFNIHVGSAAWLSALKRDGAKVDVEAFVRDWKEKAKVYQQQSKKYWLYN
ncbi:MAG TPA: DUF1343 domain-containing protein [Opitutaceae bacterium]|nr:DUF1343 domain-containing protein [Opitutaceae bacterium]